MKKINNKGVTIAEFIVCFVILMVLVFGMMDTLLKVKDDNNLQQRQKEWLEYKSTLTKTITDDLLKKHFDISETTTNPCETTNVTTCTFKFKDEDVKSRKLEIDPNEFLITYDGVKYQIPYKEFLSPMGFNISVNDKFLEIDISYYELTDDKKENNYGINIIFPYKFAYTTD